MADKIQHDPRYFDKTIVFGHVEDKFEVDINSTMKFYLHAPTRARFVPKKKACALPHQQGISTGTISESKVMWSYHSMSFFSFSFVSLFTFVKWQMTSHVNWQIWRHNSISFVAVWSSRLCQIGSPYTISDQYHNHIFSHLQSSGALDFSLNL